MGADVCKIIIEMAVSRAKFEMKLGASLFGCIPFFWLQTNKQCERDLSGFITSNNSIVRLFVREKISSFGVCNFVAHSKSYLLAMGFVLHKHVKYPQWHLKTIQYQPYRLPLIYFVSKSCVWLWIF